MNKERRTKLKDLIGRIEELQSEIETLKDEEDDYFSNMPESLQQGEKGQAAEAAVEALTSAVDSFADIISNIEIATE